MWSPQFERGKHGPKKSQFYDNMTRVELGDVVFSFSKKEIKAIGIVISRCREHEQPRELAGKRVEWDRMGWLVDVEYTQLSKPLPPSSIINEIRPHLPTKYSPLQSNGNGCQKCYLAEVPQLMAKAIIDSIGEEAERIVSHASNARGNAIEKAIVSDPNIGETEKQALVKSRIGQGQFRIRVMKVEKCCRITGIEENEHLFACHIKPWSSPDCTNEERLDGNNGLMLTPNAHHLFDKGLISFGDDGQLLLSCNEGHRRLIAAMGISEERAIKRPFTAEQQAYIRYHRENVFRVN